MVKTNISVSVETHLLMRLDRKIEAINRASYANFSRSSYMESLLIKENEIEHLRFLAQQKAKELLGLKDLLTRCEECNNDTEQESLQNGY